MRPAAGTVRLVVAVGAAAAAATGGVLAWTPAPPGSAAPGGDDLLRAKGCVTCHVVPGGARQGGPEPVGPPLVGLGERAGERVEGMGAAEYVARSIRTPDAHVVEGFPGVMPDLDLTDEEIDVLVEHLLAG